MKDEEKLRLVSDFEAKGSKLQGAPMRKLKSRRNDNIVCIIEKLTGQPCTRDTAEKHERRRNGLSRMIVSIEQSTQVDLGKKHVS